jgi:hypothetical protein
MQNTGSNGLHIPKRKEYDAKGDSKRNMVLEKVNESLVLVYDKYS